MHQRMTMAFETGVLQGLCICSSRLGERKPRGATLLETPRMNSEGEEGRRDSRAEKYLRRRGKAQSSQFLYYSDAFRSLLYSILFRWDNGERGERASRRSVGG